MNYSCLLTTQKAHTLNLPKINNLRPSQSMRKTSYKSGGMKLINDELTEKGIEWKFFYSKPSKKTIELFHENNVTSLVSLHSAISCCEVLLKTG